MAGVVDGVPNLRAVVNLIGAYAATGKVHETDRDQFDRMLALNCRLGGPADAASSLAAATARAPSARSRAVRRGCRPLTADVIEEMVSEARERGTSQLGPLALTGGFSLFGAISGCFGS